MENLLKTKKTAIHLTLYKLLNPTDAKTIPLYWLKTVSHMKTGGSFGERALLKHEPRAASILCTEDSTFATLSRHDYNWIMSVSMKKDLKERVKFFRQFRVLSKLRTTTIEKLQYGMRFVTRLRG
jgi:CRP-like cAMP-binding protein